MNNIEAIKKKRDLSKETKKQISKKIIANALICIGMLLLLMIYRITADFLTIEIAISMYHTSAMLILLIALEILVMFSTRMSSSLTSGSLFSRKSSLQSFELIFATRDTSR